MMILLGSAELRTPHQTHSTLKGGGGVHSDFVELDFEIVVDQQTKARDRT